MSYFNRNCCRSLCMYLWKYMPSKGSYNLWIVASIRVAYYSSWHYCLRFRVSFPCKCMMHIMYSHTGILPMSSDFYDVVILFSGLKFRDIISLLLSRRFTLHVFLFRLGCYSAYLCIFALQQIDLWIRLQSSVNCCIFSPVMYPCCICDCGSNRRQMTGGWATFGLKYFIFYFIFI